MYGFPRNNYNWIFQKNMTTKLNDLKHDCVAIMMNFVAQARWAWCTFIILCLHMILMWFSWQKCVCNNCSDSGYFWRIWTVKLIEIYFCKISFLSLVNTNTQNQSKFKCVKYHKLCNRISAKLFIRSQSWKTCQLKHPR